MRENELDQYPWYQLKYGIAEFLVPKLEEYKARYAEEGVSIPTWLALDAKDSYSDVENNDLRDAWLMELNKMILAFKMVLNSSTGEDPALGYDEDIIQLGVESFSKHYQHLWD